MVQQFISLLFIFPLLLNGQTSLPLFQISDMQYNGAFRLPATTFGASSLNYSEGPIEYNPINHSLFIVGHDHQQAIAEFSIPELVNGSLDQLNMGSNLQAFVSILNRPICGNNQNIDQIAGIKLVGTKLWVNAYEYYDADNSVSNTSLIIDDAIQLSSSSVRGYFDLEGGAGHTSGWISKIPPEWQGTLDGTHITGQSSGIPIISRCSVGPSAFSFTPDTVAAQCNSVATHQLLDFSLTNPLTADLENNTGENDLWTHLSRATYGMIVPGTRTYITLGYSGGHQSGVCYKCTQDDGNTCGGYCPPQADDYEQYYWLWDVNDLIAVKNGTILPYEVEPYNYGPFHTPFENSNRQIGGGTFDPVSGILYLSIQKADTSQGIYANPPVIIAYQISAPTCISCCQSAVSIHTSDVSNGMRVYSQDFIQAVAYIDGYSNILWKAGDFIELLPQFEIKNGSDLTIVMEECPN